MPRIYQQKNAKLTESDWLELAQILVKAGYIVRKGREKANPKLAVYTHFIEFWEDKIYDESQ